MSDNHKSTYGFDPFASGSGTRWGRRGNVDDAPEIEGYEIIDNLGAGGMGAVWSARYLPLNQIRAIKVLDKALAQDPTFIERFSQEAKALGRLQHPHIVRVFDAHAESNPPYIAMQWVEGKTLSEVLAQRPVPLKDALRYFRQVAAALDYAHSMGFVHRDLKPSNVMITAADEAMLIDFGVANFLGRDVGGAGTVTGTTRYMAPEVIQGRMATSASDLWAFAVLIYRVLTGKLPFDGRSSDEVFKKITTEAPLPPTGVNQKLAKFLTEVLQKEPGKRYRSATQMVDELTAAARPWVPQVKGEGLAVGASMAILGAFALVIVIGIAGFAFSLFQRPKTRVVEKKVEVPVAVKPKPNAPTSTVAPIVGELKGAWFADLGTRFADVVLEPAGERKFSLGISYRTAEGVTPSTAAGEVGEDGKTVTFREGQATFTGTVSEDRARIAGDLGSETFRLVRAADLALTPFEDAAVGVSAAVPAGWTTSSTVDGESKIVTLHPIGLDSVGLRVMVTPERQGATLQDILAVREQALQAESANGGTYSRTNINESAELGGRGAVMWEYRFGKSGAPVNLAVVYALMRGENSTLVESYVPVDQSETWTPVLDRIRARMGFQ